MEKKTARNWYWWLWFSPLLTVPTLVILLAIVVLVFEADFNLAFLVAIPVSALWHLILLIPALDKAHAFVRWHGRQALLLAGVRTVIPLAFMLVSGEDYPALLAIPALLLVWFTGTLWGQHQAVNGVCSLMQWFGQEETLSILRDAEAEARTGEAEAEALVEIIRFSRDRDERRSALAELQRRGMVETL